MTIEQHFRITAINALSVCTLALVFTGIAATTVFALQGDARILTLGLTSLLLLLILGHMASACVSITEDGLRIGAGLYRRRIARSDLVAVEDATKTSLGWRTNGIGLPGFCLGRFSGSDGRRLFVAVGRRSTDTRLRLRLRGDFDAIVAVRDSSALERALRSMQKRDTSAMHGV